MFKFCCISAIESGLNAAQSRNQLIGTQNLFIGTKESIFWNTFDQAGHELFC